MDGDHDALFYWRQNNQPWVPNEDDLAEIAAVRDSFAELRPGRWHLRSRLLGAFVAGFVSAIAIAQARGLNSRPYSRP